MKNKNKGFTLAELLIVVAIIAVLVAISIPIFNNQLKKARLATNQANGRAAFSAAEAAYLDYVAEHGSAPVNKSSNSQDVTYTYFPAAGKGILNFTLGDMRWLYGSTSGGRGVAVSDNIDVSSWTVDTVLSDENMIGDNVAEIWTIHMKSDTGAIKGYYCAFPSAGKANHAEEYQIYKDIVRTLSNDGNVSKWQQKDTR